MSMSFGQLQPTVLITVTELRVTMSFVNFASSPQKRRKASIVKIEHLYFSSTYYFLSFLRVNWFSVDCTNCREDTNLTAHSPGFFEQFAVYV